MTATVSDRARRAVVDGSVETRRVLHAVGARQGREATVSGGSVIIPAHDEADVIDRTLASLGDLCGRPGFEVIVVCNGCSDDTASAARAFPGVTVVEIDEASKPAALNVGDRTATAWPRLYLDADIEIDPGSVLAVFAALASDELLAARPSYVYDTVGAQRAVVGYYRARSRIPAPESRLWGAGGYALNERGHRRFDQFPAVTADDSWFDEQFSDDEKAVIPTVPMRVRTPRDIAGLIAVLTRQRRGQVELGVPSTASRRSSALLRSVRGPGSALDAAYYVALTAIARHRSNVALRVQARSWERDASSRTSGPAS